MRKSLALTLGAMLVAASVWAQEPSEVPLYFAVAIPDANVPNIDGSNADWKWVDKSFEVTIEDMHALTGSAENADDLFIDILVGWSQSKNSMYGMVHSHDDFLIVDKNPSCTFRDDNCEVHFDPDNQGGGPYSAPVDQDLQPAFQMCLSFSDQFPRVQMYNGALANFNQSAFDFWWTHSGDFVKANMVNQGQEYYFEFSAILFDPLSISGGPTASTKWVLAPEQTIGMSISVDDADEGVNANGVLGQEDLCDGGCPDGFFWQAQFSMSEQFMNTGGMPDIFLTAPGTGTAVESTSWGQLKTLIKEDI